MSNAKYTHAVETEDAVIPSVIMADLMDDLFEPEDRRLYRQMAELNVANKRLKHLSTDGFIYNGNFFRPVEGAVTLAGPGLAKATLDYSLHDEMERWLRDRKLIGIDRSLVRQTLYNLIWTCISIFEVRDALPECLVPLVPRLSQLSRSRPAGYTLHGKPMAIEQFNRVLPRMEFYSVTRMLY